MPLPSSALSFKDLIIEAARKIGVASYGSDGSGEVDIPDTDYDLDEVKRHVNNAVRMYLNDGPAPNGWRFARPTDSIVVWGTIAVNAANTVSSTDRDTLNDRTTLQAVSDSFYPTMEGKPLVVTGVGTFTIYQHVSATKVIVVGDASSAAAATWSMTADGNYTMPAVFGGEYIGDITYVANSNQGVGIDWMSEGHIRQWRESITDETGEPYWACVRPMNSEFENRRRWELMLYPQPDEIVTLEMPYILGFDKMLELNEHPPVPVSHDEALKAAVLALVEKDVEGALGIDWQYYHDNALPKAYQVDARSAPKSIGYIGNRPARRGSAIQDFRQNWYDRPTVNTSGIDT